MQRHAGAVQPARAGECVHVASAHKGDDSVDQIAHQPCGAVLVQDHSTTASTVPTAHTAIAAISGQV